MKLNAKSASVWLAVPLLAIAIAACGDSDSTTPPLEEAGYPDGQGPGSGQGEFAECGDGILDESETTEEECDGTTTCTDDCEENVCGDGFVGPGEGCDEDSDTCIDCSTVDCGNGTIEGDEECDDGAGNSDTGACTDACEENVCGDGLQGPDEECDNGADNGDDGNICTSTCDEDVHGNGHIGPGESCDDGNMIDDDDCTNEGGPPRCGDGIVQDGEGCDDGNTSDRDECLSSCQPAICGDGEIQTGVEECDDGPGSNTDGCTNGCLLPVCGDGYLQQGELCDEGEDNADDGDCNTNCTTAECGDGVVQDGEECDDGNTSNTDSCLSTCVWASCGDNLVYSNVSDDTNPNPVEECDDQNNSNADTCTNACLTNICGDGLVGPGEACDLGADNGIAGGTCTATCTSTTCGDGVVGAGEECEDGNTDETDSCAACMWNSCGDGFPYLTATDPTNTNPVEECDDGDESDANTCTNACTTAVCGDGIVGPGEGCDDGNADDTDGCNSLCVSSTCGNGVVDGTDQCDDGNLVNTDACTNACTNAVCGDSFIQGTEECDDGNSLNDDGCVTGCVANVCGDGFRDPATEECDLGALNGPGGTCTTECTIGACGNGELDPGEDCDEGTGTAAYADNTDSCLNNCQWNDCGDGALYVTVSNNSNPNAVEQCDDANTDESDLCLASCVYNSCGDNNLLVGWDSEPYDDPDGTGPMTASRGAGGVPIWQAGTAQEISPFDFDADSEECDDGNTANTDACVRSDFDGDGINECRVAACGDGFVQATVEQCDDQNTNNNDSCIDTCEYNVCHDGWLYTTSTIPSNPNALEQCDDGNTADNDSCVLQCVNPSCGDGIIQPGEGCDNAGLNGTPGNACQANCQITTCGDGVVQVANGEQCDQGVADGSNNDQCLTTCRWNRCGDGFAYTTTDPGPNNAAPIEECDDGNGNNRDACLTTCQDAGCGDGFVWFLNEDCDDGNNVNNDECSNVCGAPDCGDGILQDGEECDDGGTCEGGLFVGQSCDADSDCLISNANCRDTCDGGPSNGNTCTADAQCGYDGDCVDTSECTGGTNNGGSCTPPGGVAGPSADCPTETECVTVCQGPSSLSATACVADAGCTVDYGILVTGSCDTVAGFCRLACDDNTDCNGGDACGTSGACFDGGSTCSDNSDCPAGPNATCSADVCAANAFGTGGNVCTLDSDCDVDFDCDGATECDGGVNLGLACNAAGPAPYLATNNPQCPVYDTCTAQDGDGCSNYDDPATVDVDEAICEFSRCGDGILDPAEGCEIDDSGVTPVILVHSGTLAPGTTCNACVLSTCGATSGTQAGEQCDDGNTDNTDGCTTSCRNAQCGDGIVQVGEECDDANGVETDECTNACLWNVCGDGVRFTGTPTANTGAAQLCDAGDLIGAGGIFSRGRDDGDGYDDQPAFCNGQCEVICDGTTGIGASLWKSNNWCLMAAEEYPLAPVDPLAPGNELDDAGYTDFELNWDDAVEYCEDLGIGARLVQYDSVANAATLGGIMSTLSGGDDWWVGAFDNFAEAAPDPVPSNPGRFVWLDDTSVTDGFVGGRPDGSGDCAAANSGNTPTGYMTDETCGTANRFFCEYQGPFPRTAL